MKKEFNVAISSFKKISKIQNAWSTDDYKALLAMIDIEEDELTGLSDSEIKEMCLMSLSDLEPDESAKLLLKLIFNDKMTDGKMDQLSHQMADNDLWEEHADPAYHMSFFNAYGLLRQAYNGTFSEPSGVTFTITITGSKDDSFEIFEDSLHAVIVRLISEGLDESAILNRLFEEQISGNTFASAKDMLWIVNENSKTEKEHVYEITSSHLWFGELKDIESFGANAHADTALDSNEEN